MVAALEDSGVRASSRLAYVECGAAFARAEREGRTSRGLISRLLEDLDEAWGDMAVVELDEPIAVRSVSIARERALRASDAIHLASALAIAPPSGEVTFACFDRRLWEAAGGFGLRLLPQTAP
jgi:predicted nucleic acid-binding protein